MIDERELADRFVSQWDEHARITSAAMPVLTDGLVKAAGRLSDCLAAGGCVMACGNGGSAADAQHFAAELVNRFETDRPERSALALTTDSSVLTSVANDFSFDQVFAKQLRALARRGDMLLALSTSGSSPSVLRAVEAAHARGMSVLALTGEGGGALAGMLKPSDLLLAVPSRRTARVQEVHILLLHCLCDGVDQLLGKGAR